MYAGANCPPEARFHFTMPDGAVRWLTPDQALDVLAKTRKFLAAPYPADSPALDDGRTEVALFNVASLMQHLRWQCGLDADSRPVRSKDGAKREIKWTPAAETWFRHNAKDKAEEVPA